jgi:predicted O-methyltransferase YrrM
MKLSGTLEAIAAVVLAEHPQAQAAVARARKLTAGNSTKGTVLDYQALVLYAIARGYNQPVANILEIGTYYGATAAVMAQAAPEAQIVTLNPLAWEVEIAERVLAGYTNVRVVRTTSQEYLATYRGPELDLIFVDGDHKRIGEDLAWWDRVAVGGTMLFHDYSPLGALPNHCPPVVRALDGFTAYLGRAADWQVIDHLGTGMLGWVKQAGDKNYDQR